MPISDICDVKGLDQRLACFGRDCFEQLPLLESASQRVEKYSLYLGRGGQDFDG